MNVSRRNFLKLGALSVGAAIAAGSIPALTLAESGVQLPDRKNIPGLVLPSGMENKPAQKLFLGNFITMDETRPTAKAMTVVDGRIQYIGSTETALALCNYETLVMDCGDAYIYPGFLEGHCHPRGAGGTLVGAANLRSGKCLADYVELMKQYIEAHPDNKFYKGTGFAVRDEHPTAAMLDEICQDKPVIVISEDAHSVWVNTAAMKEYGVTPERAVEIGTDCVRVDEKGNPIGYISENEAIRIQNAVPITTEDRKRFLLAWQKFAFSQGYTAASDATFMPIDMDAYYELTRTPEWKLRTYGWYYEDEKNATTEQMVERAAAAAEKCNSEYLKVIGIKLFMDGVIEAHTGWLLDGYSDQPGYPGVARQTDVNNLKKAVVMTNEHGMNIHVHSIGDAATKTILDAIELGQRETGNYDQRNALAHLEVVRPEDIVRLTDNHVVAVVAPLWVPREPAYSANELLYLGEEREANCYPIQKFRDNGGVIAFHTDFPVSPKMNIPQTIFQAVTRYNYENGKDTIRGEKEVISRRDALLGLTRNVAYMWHEENRLGTLEVGKIANLSIYDTDFMNAPLDQVVQAKLCYTVVDGDVVYSGDDGLDEEMIQPSIGDVLLRTLLGLLGEQPQ